MLLWKNGGQHISVREDSAALDVGCGGRVNIRKLLELCPKGAVRGVDYSEVSVEKSREVNTGAIRDGLFQVLQSSVTELPSPENTFDLVTAFETIYFWRDLQQSFRQIHRVLRVSFLICSESNGETGKDDKWTSIISGMTIYTGKQLGDILLNAGFTGICTEKNSQGWICVTAKK